MASVEPKNPISVNENQNASSSFRPVCDGQASPWLHSDEIFKFKCITKKSTHSRRKTTKLKTRQYKCL